MINSEENTDSRDHVSLDTAVSLSFDYLKQLSTLALGAAGGLVTLVQFMEGGRTFHLKAMLAVGALFLSAFLAFLTQYSLVDRISQQHGVLKKAGGKPCPQDKAKKLERAFTAIAIGLLGIGIGMALQAVLKAGM